MPNITQITPPRVPLIDERTGAVSREWYRWFYNLYYATGGTTGGAIPTDRGGTGTTDIPADGQILVGLGAERRYKVTDLGTGAGIGATVGPGSLSIENTGVLSNIAGSGIEVDQATGDVTISNSGVLSIIAGDGIGTNGSTGDVTISNTGVLSIIAGPGIEVDQATGNVTISTTSVADQEIQTATSGQTVFNLTTMTYVPGSNSLSVFIDGVNQILGDAYTETNSTRVTFTAGLHVGAKVRFATA